jgi:hypothetical protein
MTVRSSPLSLSSHAFLASVSPQQSMLIDRVWVVLCSAEQDLAVQELRERLAVQWARHAGQPCDLAARNLLSKEQLAELFAGEGPEWAGSDEEQLARWLRVSCRWRAVELAAAVLHQAPASSQDAGESSVARAGSQQVNAREAIPSAEQSEPPADVLHLPSADREGERPAPSREGTPEVALALPERVDPQEGTQARLPLLSRRQLRRALAIASLSRHASTSPSNPVPPDAAQTRSHLSRYSPGASSSGSSERGSPAQSARSPLPSAGSASPPANFAAILHQIVEVAEQRSESVRDQLRQLGTLLHRSRPQPEQLIDALRALRDHPEIQRSVVKLLLEAMPISGPASWTQLWTQVTERLCHEPQRAMVGQLAQQLLFRNIHPELQQRIFQWAQGGATELPIIQRLLSLGRWDPAWLEPAARLIRSDADLPAMRSWMRSESMTDGQRLELFATVLAGDVTHQSLSVPVLLAILEQTLVPQGSGESNALLRCGMEQVLGRPEGAAKLGRSLKGSCTSPVQMERWLGVLMSVEVEDQRLSEVIWSSEIPFKSELWCDLLQSCTLEGGSISRPWRLLTQLIDCQWPWSPRHRQDLQTLLIRLAKNPAVEVGQIALLVLGVRPAVGVELMQTVGTLIDDRLHSIHRQELAPLLLQAMPMEQLDALLAESTWSCWFAEEAPESMQNGLQACWQAAQLSPERVQTHHILVPLLQIWSERFRRASPSHLVAPWWVGELDPGRLIAQPSARAKAQHVLQVLRLLEDAHRLSLNEVHQSIARIWVQQIQLEGVPLSVIQLLEEQFGGIAWEEADLPLMATIGESLGERLEQLLDYSQVGLDVEHQANAVAGLWRRGGALPPWTRFWRLAVAAGPFATPGLTRAYAITSNAQGETGMSLRAGLVLGLLETPFWERFAPGSAVDAACRMLKVLSFERCDPLMFTSQVRQLLHGLLNWAESQPLQTQAKSLEAVLRWLEMSVRMEVFDEASANEMVGALARLARMADALVRNGEAGVRGESLCRGVSKLSLALLLNLAAQKPFSEAVEAGLPFLHALSSGVFGSHLQNVAEIKMGLTLLMWKRDGAEKALEEGGLLDGLGPKSGGSAAAHQPIFRDARLQLLSRFAELDREQQTADARVALAAMFCHAVSGQISGEWVRSGLWQALGGDLEYRLGVVANSIRNLNEMLAPEDQGAPLTQVLGVPLLAELPDDPEACAALAKACVARCPGGVMMISSQLLYWRAMANVLYANQATVPDSIRTMRLVRSLLAEGGFADCVPFIDRWLERPSLLDVETLRRAGFVKQIEMVAPSPAKRGRGR